MAQATAQATATPTMRRATPTMAHSPQGARACKSKKQIGLKQATKKRCRSYFQTRDRPQERRASRARAVNDRGGNKTSAQRTTNNAGERAYLRFVLRHKPDKSGREALTEGDTAEPVVDALSVTFRGASRSSAPAP